MLKRYNVIVNGVSYQVEVEEVNGEFINTPIVNDTTPQVVSKTKEVDKPAEVNEEIKKSVPSKDGAKIECPMPGTILNISISEGQVVKEGEVMFILEAMKMENEIMAPKDCKIIQLGVSKGQSVNTGDLLAVIE